MAAVRSQSSVALVRGSIRGVHYLMNAGAALVFSPQEPLLARLAVTMAHQVLKSDQPTISELLASTSHALVDQLQATPAPRQVSLHVAVVHIFKIRMKPLTVSSIARLHLIYLL